LRSGISASPDFLTVAGYRLFYFLTQLGIALDETGMKLLKQTQEIVRDEDLPIAAGAGADANGRDVHGFGDFPGQFRRQTLEHDREGSRLFDGAGIFKKPDGVALDAKSSQAMNGLRGQANVAHDGYVGRGDGGDGRRTAH